MRQPFRPQVNDQQRPAAEGLETVLLGAAAPAREWNAAPSPLPPAPEMPAMPRRPRPLSVSALIDHYGGAKALAARVGLSPRQIQRWQAGTADPSRGLRSTREAFRAAHDEAAHADLAERRRQVRTERKAIREGQRDERRAAGQREWAAIVERHGGAAALAGKLGRHPRTVERWVAGESTPNGADQKAMAGLDRRYRVAASLRGTAEHDQEQGGTATATGAGGAGAGAAGTGEGLRPGQRVFIRAQGNMVAQGYYNYQRNIGVQGLGPGGMHELPPEVASEFYDRMSNGDSEGALDVLQAHLSVDYAQCGGYEADGDLGVHMQSIDDFEWQLG